ncbi:MAG TPA: hypothetical protein VFT82_01125 [Candidatus Paceibacterota bacterium]|nr:hypothetical protein [Candidatus Paceibacterota bacterium]
MADKTKENSYLKEVLHFYFAPELRSLGTLVYLGVFGYFTLYYIDNLFLAIRFLLYVLLGHTALSGTAYLFTGLAFVISLILPFFVSFYAIFVLHKIWDKPNWAPYVKWLITLLILITSVLIIIVSDSASRLAARQPIMQSFIEDANLTAKI